MLFAGGLIAYSAAGDSPHDLERTPPGRDKTNCHICPKEK